MQDRREIAMDTIGETSVFSSYDRNFNLIRRIYNNDTTNNKVRYFWNQNSSKILEESAVGMAKYSNLITIPLSNIDPNYFNIDTLFTIVSDKKFINGVYTLRRIVFLYQPMTIYTSNKHGTKINKIKINKKALGFLVFIMLKVKV